ncbi:GntR family transcriptional regulator [Subtercola sp. YIM 133946]|uniref:GntR family transcriptional regulator n=1 Tax=Subtercola sp. YIM 133946 TaxID=3118909 RepID=UPI002F9396AC
MTDPGRPARGAGSRAKPELLEEVKSAILRGEFVPLQRLIESDLSERFGASRSAVRIALQELVSQGLVEFQPNKGARVRSISVDEAIEITEVRVVLEGMEASLAAERVTDAEAAELSDIAVRMREAVEAGELLTYSDLNVRLHASIREAARHETSARLLRELRNQTARHQFSLALVPGRPSQSLPQHEAIVAAIVARDVPGAEDAMKAHLRSVIDALRALPSLDSARR